MDLITEPVRSPPVLILPLFLSVHLTQYCITFMEVVGGIQNFNFFTIFKLLTMKYFAFLVFALVISTATS